MSWEPALVDVAVPGGDLAVAVSGPPPHRARATVLLVHGLTGSHRVWSLVPPRLPADVAVVAPDLRGRGASCHLPGPFGLRAHAADCALALDRLGAGPVVVAGHSFGAFVAAAMARERPGAVAAGVLVDGGLAVPARSEDHARRLLAATLGPTLARLGHRFRSREEHRRFWQGHPALAAGWNEAVERFVAHDCGGVPPCIHSRVSAEAAEVDGVEVLVDPHAASAAVCLGCPVEVLRAERGLDDRPPPVIPGSLAAAATRANPGLRITTVPGVNHLTIALSPAGADAIAFALTRALAAVPRAV